MESMIGLMALELPELMVKVSHLHLVLLKYQFKGNFEVMETSLLFPSLFL